MSGPKCWVSLSINEMTGLWTSFFSPEVSNKNVKPHGPLHSKVPHSEVLFILQGASKITFSWVCSHFPKLTVGVCKDNLFLTKAWWHPFNLRPWKAAGHEHRAAPAPTCQHTQKGITVGEKLGTKLSPGPLREDFVSPNSEEFAVGFVDHTKQENWLHRLYCEGEKNVSEVWGYAAKVDKWTI